MFCAGVVAVKIYSGYVIIFLLLVHSLSARLSTGLDYDFASHAAQQGNWEQAQKLLSPLLIDSHDRADLLYDLGIVFYENGDLQTACTYFSHAAACEDVSDELCEQAHFNAGNKRVDLDELENAIEQYEKVLTINPANKFAQHNLDKVKKMLKQKQEQEEQKQKKENQQKDAQQDEKNNASKENKKTSHDGKEKNNQQDQNNQPRDSQSDNGNQNGESEKKIHEKDHNDNQEQSTLPNNESPNESSQDCDEKDEQCQQAERGTDGKEREQKGSKQNRRDQRNCSNDKDQGYRNNETNDKSKEQPHDKQHNNTENHNFTSEQQDIPTSSPDTHPQNKHQEQKKQDIRTKQLKSGNTTGQNNPDAMNPQDQWITAILEKQAEKDKQANKKIMEAKIQRECAGKYGQNCW